SEQYRRRQPDPGQDPVAAATDSSVFHCQSLTWDDAHHPMTTKKGDSRAESLYIKVPGRFEDRFARREVGRGPGQARGPCPPGEKYHTLAFSPVIWGLWEEFRKAFYSLPDGAFNLKGEGARIVGDFRRQCGARAPTRRI